MTVRRQFSLDDKYTLVEGSVYLTGIQALVRLPLDQMRRDRRAGLRTACFISGYEGSPLGGYDLALERVGKLLSDHDVRFQPGLNEDLAVTSILGTQLAETFPQPLKDGVVGIWYGKGPGVDRSADAFRHANLAGTGTHGGALALAGDDHVSKSSTIPHQSEFSLMNVGMPVLAAADAQDALDLGLAGIAMSRFSGAWVGLKLATDVCDGGRTVEVSSERNPVVVPEFLVDGEAYQKRLEPMLLAPASLELERHVLGLRLDAARAFARANGLNRILFRHDRDRLGVIAVGKSFADLMTALRNCGIGEPELERLGVRILRLAMPFPLEPEIVDQFTDGLDEVLVLEEKRSFAELQLRDLLYDRARRPAVYGTRGPGGAPLLPETGELDAETIARALEHWFGGEASFRERLNAISRAELRARPAGGESAAPRRGPSYCSGCPHNRSTLLLEGQIAGGGIGCHGMAARMGQSGRGISYIAQMGSEGAHWIGLSPYTGVEHIFQNIGDGTYFHSGRQAVLAALAAGSHVTYKILYNGAVAMTGGQQAAGAIPIPALTRQLEADGVEKIVVLADDLDRYDDVDLARAAELRSRDRLEETLAEMPDVPGVSVLIYDQMCAAEKRRRRNRGKLPQPVRRLMIHEPVCEGCGDCVSQSNCVSLTPVSTEYGPKTRIHQSSCNVDLSCLQGDCPSFVSVLIEEGTGLKRKRLPELPEVEVSEPDCPPLEGARHILMPGVGGTGVVTINALLAVAAQLDGLHVTTLDQTGLAQKGGAVVSHLAVSAERMDAAARISYAATDLLLGFDLLGAAASENLPRLSPERTTAVVNADETPTFESVRQGLVTIAADGALASTIRRSTREGHFLNASKIAQELFGSHLQANTLLLGGAYQTGALPVSRLSIEEAIRLNGVAVERNLAAFHWGRVAVAEPERIEALLRDEPLSAASLDDLIATRAAELVCYQSSDHADEYRAFVDRTRAAEQALSKGEALTRAVASNLFKLMAYKDEYEVARLLTDGSIEEQAAATFESPKKVIYHLHPPLLRFFGLKRKLALGPWVKPLLRLTARLKFLRGTPFDPFGRTASRRLERELVAWYRDWVQAVLEELHSENHEAALEVLRAPESIRGYEGVREASVAETRSRVQELLKTLSRRAVA